MFDIMSDPSTVLKFVDERSKHQIQIFLGRRWKSSVIYGLFRNCQKMFGNVLVPLSLVTFGESLEIFRKWSEIFGKSSKTIVISLLIFNLFSRSFAAFTQVLS